MSNFAQYDTLIREERVAMWPGGGARYLAIMGQPNPLIDLKKGANYGRVVTIRSVSRRRGDNNELKKGTNGARPSAIRPFVPFAFFFHSRFSSPRNFRQMHLIY
jgi:hypothetical protein